MRPVVIDREALQLRIGFTFVETIKLGRIVTCSDAGSADVEREFRRVKEVVEQLLSRICGELVENVAGSIGERGAKAQNLLEFFFGLECDDVPGGLLTRTRPPRQSGRALEAPLLVGHANGDFAGGGIRGTCRGPTRQ